MGTTTQKMTDEQQRGAFTRRQFLKGSGVLVVGFSTAAIAPWEKLAAAAQGVAVADYPEFDLAAVDSFLEVHAGFVLIKIGKINNGQGTPTSWVMIAADELDVPLNRVQVRFGDTAATPDQDRPCATLSPAAGPKTTMRVPANPATSARRMRPSMGMALCSQFSPARATAPKPIQITT